MAVLPVLIFLALLLGAIAFACWPILRRREQALPRRVFLAAAVALVVLGIGTGIYLMLGRPYLAERAVAPRDNDLRSLVAQLSVRVLQTPNDPRGWTLLGKGYLTLGDANDAAAAFRRAVPLTAPPQQAVLLAAEGEALTMAAGGIVPPDAETMFHQALRLAPQDFAARYYLGLAYATRRDNVHALSLWQGLLADAPANAPWRGTVVDRIAALKAQSGAAPDIGAMVAGLAARLHDKPDDPQGWQRLIRAYAVLGDNAKAHTALADARAAAKSNTQALAALSVEAKSLKLEK
ncbi:MAG TPA: tetratricopeptide repeat protein [Rhizomicrobium sp.]|jgi:cytochrome c-type biogenesis protein CcmH